MNDADIVAQALREATERFRRATNAYRDLVTKRPLKLNRHAAREVLASAPRLFLGYCALVRLLKSYPEFLARRSSVVVVTVPRNWSLEDMEHLAGICFKDEDRNTTRFNAFCHPTARNRKGLWDITPQVQLAYPKVLVLALHGAELHPEIEAAADAVLALDLSPNKHLDALAKLLGTGVNNNDEKDFLRQQQAAFMDSVFRVGRPSAPMIARLTELTSKRKKSGKHLPLATFGEAGIWAENLQADLRAWQAGAIPWCEIDRGVLVHGPPGTGKTSFAVSLAAHLGVPLVSASLAQWQSAGHLGDLLRVMYADFSKARGDTPSVLFIDEMDALGDRRKFSGQSAQYCTEVVNALLEALDGTMNREGVIVVAASNYPDRIDPAFLRSGRLERHIELPRPTLAARAAIIELYLPDISPEAIQEAAGRLQGATGADIEYLARRARRIARTEGRPVSSDDLLGELPPRVHLSKRDLWRVCVHEAGHAVLARLFNVGVIASVEVVTGDHPTELSSDQAHGQVILTKQDALLESETSLRGDIAMRLGGMVAEELFLGDRSTTSGGSERSDLSLVTELAIRMIGTYGMGRSLGVIPGRLLDPADEHLFERNPGLQREVDFLLKTEHKRAKQTLKSHRDVVLALAKALESNGRLVGEQLEALLAPLEQGLVSNTIP
ncbi:MAG: AAA family ATPase [Pseudorhizobium pelagicum]|uniref:AAA family ATPase n=1 Tax=Pseudorhizobium pelagicum TaxID=1509405 RepID=UPI0034617666